MAKQWSPSNYNKRKSDQSNKGVSYGGGLSANSNESWGDEYYTHPYIADMIARDYKYIFDEYDFILMPFNSDDKPMFKIFKQHYGNKVISLPETCYDQQLGFKNFFKFKQNYKFMELINNNKVIVFDNPPFSIFKKIVAFLDKSQDNLFEYALEKDLDYILFADTLTGLQKIENRTTGYHILNRVIFISDRTDTDDTVVNVGLFSNLFNGIEPHFFNGGKSLNNKMIGWNDKTNEENFTSSECLPSSRIINYCQRGMKIPFEYLSNITGQHCFGGCVKLSAEQKEKLLAQIEAKNGKKS